MIVAEKIRGFHSRGSAIRRMFEEGLRLKALHGADRVADLSIGNPDFPPPALFREAFREAALADLPHAYMPNAGYPETRERVARHLDRRCLLPGVGASHIVMTTGAAGAINVVLKTILEPGDEVVVVKPYFLEYGYYIDNHGGRMVLADSRPDFEIDPDAIEQVLTERTRAVLVNSPNNPSGRVYAEGPLRQVSDVLLRASARFGRPILLLSDEPYREVVFDGVPFVSPATLYPNSVICYSWSKSFSLSGERIGYAAVNPRIETDDTDLFLSSLAMCNRLLGFVNAPAFLQHVIARAVDAVPDISHYERKRARLLAALDMAGIETVRPEGTFYLFPKTPGDEAAFVQRLKDRLLLVVPGSAFGRSGHFRISFAAPDATVDLACRILETLA